MNKKKTKSQYNSKNDDSTSSKSSRHSPSSSNHHSPRDVDNSKEDRLIINGFTLITKNRNEPIKKRNTINLPRDHLQQQEGKIRKSSSINFDVTESRKRKSRSKSELSTAKKRTNKMKIKSSDDESMTMDHLVLNLQKSVKRMELMLEEEKSNRILFQIVMKNQSEVIENLKERLTTQEIEMESLRDEIILLQTSIKEQFLTPVKQFRKGSSEKNIKKRNSKSPSIKKLKSDETSLEEKKEKKTRKEKKFKKTSEKRANSSPSLGKNRSKLITSKVESTSCINSPRSEYETDESENSRVTFEGIADLTEKVSEITNNQSSMESSSKKSKKESKTQFKLNLSKIKTKRSTINGNESPINPMSPKSEINSPRFENDSGYGSDGTIQKRHRINQKRSSAPRLPTQQVKSPTVQSKINTSTDSQMRIPHPYILFPDRFKEELRVSSPTPRSLAAAISNWNLNENGIPVHLEYWTYQILNDGYVIPDLFSLSLDTHAMYQLQYNEDENAHKSCYDIAASMLHWFEELPDSLFMVSKYLHWVNACKTEGEARISFLRTLYYSLDEVNRILLSFMFDFFDCLLSIKGNKITMASIAKAFGPIFLRQFKSMNRMGITFDDLLERRNKEFKSSDTSHENDAYTLMMVLLSEKTIFNSETIVFEKIGRQYVVTSAPISNLILLLIDTNYTEREFAHIFWTTCNYFGTHTDILQMLINIYNTYDGDQKWMSNLRMRVLMAIKNWIKVFSHALCNDSSFKLILEEFKMQAKDKHKDDNGDQVFQSLVNFHALENSQNEMLPTRKVVNPNNIVLDQYDAKAFSVQLLLIHSEIMPRIEHLEIMDVRKEEKSKVKKVSNYSTVIDFINNLTMWIAYDILGRSNLNGRVKALIYYIDVANICLSLHDYNGAWAIYGAIGLHIIQRLTPMWEKLPKKDLTTFKKLEHLFEPRLNFMEYRKRYELSLKENGHAIPVLALISMDIIRYEQDPTYIDRKIDFNKMRKIHATLQSISQNNITPLYTPGQEYIKVDRLWNWLWNFKNVDEVQLENMADRKSVV